VRKIRAKAKSEEKEVLNFFLKYFKKTPREGTIFLNQSLSDYQVVLK